MKSGSNSKLVYSTEGGRICPGCRHPLTQCRCKSNAGPEGNGDVRVSRQTKGKGGKISTLIKGLAVDSAALALLGKQMRTACGSGGTVKNGVIEVQGEHCELIMAILTKHGYHPKRAGG